MGEIHEYGEYEIISYSGYMKASNKDESVVFELRFDNHNLWFSTFINGRQPYVDGLFSTHFGLGNFVARILQRKPAVYDMFDLA